VADTRFEMSDELEVLFSEAGVIQSGVLRSIFIVEQKY
jgi:hypothetical protein